MEIPNLLAKTKSTRGNVSLVEDVEQTRNQTQVLTKSFFFNEEEAFLWPLSVEGSLFCTFRPQG